MDNDIYTFWLLKCIKQVWFVVLKPVVFFKSLWFFLPLHRLFCILLIFDEFVCGSFPHQTNCLLNRHKLAQNSQTTLSNLLSSSVYFWRHFLVLIKILIFVWTTISSLLIFPWLIIVVFVRLLLDTPFILFIPKFYHLIISAIIRKWAADTVRLIAWWSVFFVKS